MIYNASENNSIICNFIAEIRDKEVQKDSMRFRTNMERIGSILAYEISKELEFETVDVETPLATAKVSKIREVPVLGTILRAGLALHQGVFNFFDSAECAFISAYRKHDQDGNFDIHLEYLSCPALQDRILILSDPMLATGSSMVLTIKKLVEEGHPRQIHVVTAIAAMPGIELVRSELPNVKIWCGAIDSELNDKAYIVPGLGDAGDLAFGHKVQL